MKLSRLWRKKKEVAPQASPYGLFPWRGTWDEAYASTDTYESETVARVISANHRKFLAGFEARGYRIEPAQQQMVLQFLASMALILSEGVPKPFRVLDFGGASGVYYYLLRRALPGIDFDWVVIDTKQMTQAHEGFTEPHLHWQTELPAVPDGFAAAPFDLCIASCCLHYLAQPQEMVRSLSRLSRNLIVTRLPMREGDEDAIAIQRVPPSVYDCTLAHWVFSEKRMVENLSALGAIKLAWTVPQDEKRLEDKPVVFKGYFVQVA